jgi:hypothetical protein
MRSLVMASVAGAVLALAGCTSALENVHTGSFFVQPGKYQFLKCPDLAKRSVDSSTREKQLVSLMERANQGLAGPLISTTVYAADLQQVRADLEELQRTSHEKGCDSLVPTKQ